MKRNRIVTGYLLSKLWLVMVVIGCSLFLTAAAVLLQEWNVAVCLFGATLVCTSVLIATWLILDRENFWRCEYLDNTDMAIPEFALQTALTVKTTYRSNKVYFSIHYYRTLHCHHNFLCVSDGISSYFIEYWISNYGMFAQA